jgi:DNA-binding Lrp family transcriptional regulator
MRGVSPQGFSIWGDILLNRERMIDEILNVGLYDLVLQDVQKVVGKEKPTKKELEEVLEKNPHILRDYMQTNVEYNLSNIHLKNIDINSLDDLVKERAKKINQNLDLLRELEKYTLDFEHSSTLVIIFSIEFFVLFSVQYFIVLLDLKEWQWWIYAFFSLSIVAAWWYAKKEKKKYEINSARYDKLYKETLNLIEELESEGYIKKEELYIDESDEHI